MSPCRAWAWTAPLMVRMAGLLLTWLAPLAACTQVARSLHLLGKHRQALQVYNEVEGEDWELWYNRGLCHGRLGEDDKCVWWTYLPGGGARQRGNWVFRHGLCA